MNILLLKKVIRVKLVSWLLKILWIRPIINNRVFYLTFNGEQFSDSPMYIFRYLNELHGSNLEHVWGFSEPDKYNDLEDIKKVKVGTLCYYLSLTCSKVIITNNMLSSYIPIRRNQIVLNTWHGGGALKKVGLQNIDIDKYDKFFFDIQNKKYSAYCCDSRYAEKTLFTKGLGFKGEILKTGLPRNAVLFSDNRDYRTSILMNLGINTDELVLLYAPTYRGKANQAKFSIDELTPNFSEVIRALEEKYNKSITLLFRAHHEIVDGLTINNSVDVSQYRDMQELIIAADVMITDYSSCMWDMALTRKPVFLYTPDIDTYLINPGFFVDYKKLPFHFCKTNKTLIDTINSFDKKQYEDELKLYFNKMGCYENADSLKNVCSWILEKMDYS